MPLRTPETWPHGAMMLDAEHTRFALWAPDAFYVSVELENGQSLPLLPQDDGWFVNNIHCPAGTRYRYCIDGELEVPDPASAPRPVTSTSTAWWSIRMPTSGITAPGVADPGTRQ